MEGSWNPQDSTLFLSGAICVESRALGPCIYTCIFVNLHSDLWITVKPFMLENFHRKLRGGVAWVGPWGEGG